MTLASPSQQTLVMLPSTPKRSLFPPTAGRSLSLITLILHTEETRAALEPIGFGNVPYSSTPSDPVCEVSGGAAAWLLRAILEPVRASRYNLGLAGAPLVWWRKWHVGYRNQIMVIGGNLRYVLGTTIPGLERILELL